MIVLGHLPFKEMEVLDVFFWERPGTHFAEQVGIGTPAIGFGLVPRLRL